MGKRCRKRFESGKPKHGGKSSSGLEPLWIHGRHAALAALANPERVVARAVVQSGDGDLEGLVEEAGRKSDRRRPKPEFKDRRELDALIGPDARHQGIAVLVEPLEFMAIEDLVRQAERRERALVVILDRATDPGNVGAVLRSAAAFGAMAVIVQERHSPRETGVMAKAASGAAEILPLIRATNIARALERLKNGGFWSVGLDIGAEPDLDQVDIGGKCALVFGAEGPGLRRLVRDSCDRLAKIPISKAMESLNLSNAVAIALYDRARRAPKN